MQTPAIHILNWRQGRTNDFVFKLYQDEENTEPVDITGVQWIMEIRTKETNALLLRKDSDIDTDMTIVEEDGSVTVHFSPEETLEENWNKPNYELVGVWPSNVIYPYFIGHIDLVASVVQV